MNVKWNMTVIDLSDDLKEEVKKLRQELADLKGELHGLTENEQRKNRGFYVDIGNHVHDYLQETMQSVAEGISGELEKSVFIGPGGVRIIRTHNHQHAQEIREAPDLVKTASVMSALGEEHRLKILGELINGGKYINELQQSLSEITASTLSSHLDVLEEAGLVVQEKMRGRYLITMPGRTAFLMAVRIAKSVEGVQQP
jgi:DNA-binding transcriptional ArsR family regulator